MVRDRVGRKEKLMTIRGYNSERKKKKNYFPANTPLNNVWIIDLSRGKI